MLEKIVLEPLAFSDICTGSIEPFAKESIAYLRGKINKNICTIISAYFMQTAERKYSGINTERKGKKVAKYYEATTPHPYSIVGDYHTHPRGECELTEFDIQDMLKDTSLVYLLGYINKIKTRSNNFNCLSNRKWKNSKTDKGIYGSALDFFLHLKAYAWNKEQQQFVEVELSCPFALWHGYFK